MKLDMIYDQGKIIDFDPVSGVIKKEIIQEIEDLNVKGNCDIVEQNICALYEENKELFFQINKQRWNLKSSGLSIRYHHIFSKKKTVFNIESSEGKNCSLEYAAWWSDIPDFELTEPEMDEDEDYLAYIYYLQKDIELQNTLISVWSLSKHS